MEHGPFWSSFKGTVSCAHTSKCDAWWTQSGSGGLNRGMLRLPVKGKDMAELTVWWIQVGKELYSLTHAGVEANNRFFTRRGQPIGAKNLSSYWRVSEAGILVTTPTQ